MNRRAALALLLAAMAAGVHADEPLSADETAAFARRLEHDVESRLRLLPAADAALAEAASRCATAIAPIRASAFRDDRPLLVGLPGGRVLVSTGLLASVESDAELASLLAHEAAHVKRGDALDRLGRSYGRERLQRIADGKDGDVLAGMGANIASGGVLVRHGFTSEQGAEDEARAAGCEGGLPHVLRRAAAGWRKRRQDRLAHALAESGAPFPGAADPSVEILGRVREALGPVP